MRNCLFLLALTEAHWVACVLFINIIILQRDQFILYNCQVTWCLSFHDFINWKTSTGLGEILRFDSVWFVFVHIICETVWVHIEIQHAHWVCISSKMLAGWSVRWRSYSWSSTVFKFLEILFWRLCQETDVEWQLVVIAKSSNVNVWASWLVVRLFLKLWIYGLIRWFPRQWGLHWTVNFIITDAVGEFVSSQVTVAPKYFAALIAFVRLVICVRQQMCLQVWPLVETSLAYGALVGRLLHVQDLVDG